MPMLLMKTVDRNLLYLNQNAYAVYVEAADKKAGDPWVRWARNFERCLPLTLWEHFANSLSYTTYDRDSHNFTREIQRIESVVRQGRVVAFPAGEYTTALEHLKNTSPKLHDRIYQSIQGLIDL